MAETWAVRLELTEVSRLTGLAVYESIETSTRLTMSLEAYSGHPPGSLTVLLPADDLSDAHKLSHDAEPVA